jgi:hypothetical protein
MIWIIFILIYIIMAVVVAVTFLYRNCADTYVSVEDLLYSFIFGLFWWVAIFFIVSIWYEEHKTDKIFEFNKKKEKDE